MTFRLSALARAAPRGMLQNRAARNHPAPHCANLRAS